jgi:hypothetical protein
MMRRSLPLVFLSLLLAGCSSEPYKIVAVSGRVTLNGKPLANASVTFAPVASGDNTEPGPSSAAITDGDGRYSLTVIGQNRTGAMVGKHKVRIALTGSNPDPADDRPVAERGQLPLKYNGKTTLSTEVPMGGTEKANFELKVP